MSRESFKIALLLLAFIPGCGRVPAEVGAESTTERAVSSSVVFLLFDPTIYGLDDYQKLEATLDETQRLFLGLPENTRVVVRLIEPRALQSAPTAELLFRFDPGFGGQRIHVDHLERDYEAVVRPRLLQAWKETHESGRITELSSCVISTLFLVGRELGTYSCNSAAVSCYMVVISDMLEACNEWGAPINLERGPAELTELSELDISEIDLSPLCSAIVVQVGSPRVTMPREIASIEDFWHKFLMDRGIRSERIVYGLRFPPEVHFKC